jgi:hypothetical protein
MIHARFRRAQRVPFPTVPNKKSESLFAPIILGIRAQTPRQPFDHEPVRNRERGEKRITSSFFTLQSYHRKRLASSVTQHKNGLNCL